jgi:hypothetical protein
MKLRVRFLQLPILFDAARLAREVAAIPPDAWRPHPRGYPGNDALPLITTHGDPLSDARDGPMAATPHLLACPYLMHVLGTLGATWGRSRLMRLSGNAEVTPHVDTDYYWRDHMRVHVPIVTQNTVRFVCGDEEVNMAAGECWVFDTWSLHSVVNDATRSRIHLVADTVGGDDLLTLMEQGRAPRAARDGWAPSRAPAPAGAPPRLSYETRNTPKVMTPWELRDHLTFLMSELAPATPNAPALGQVLNRLRVNWHALWARSGDDDQARPEYQGLLTAAWPRLVALGVNEAPLANGMALGVCLRALIFEAAVGGGGAMDAESRASPTGPGRPRSRVAPPTAGGDADADAVFDRPIFIVSPPRSGSSLLFETLADAPGLATVGGESHRLMESVPALDPSNQAWSSNRVTAAEATLETCRLLRERFRAALRDRRGSPVPPGRVRMLEKTPKNALRIPFLATVFPQARFIYLYRDPAATLASMMEGWSTGGFRTYPQLPGWTGQDWSFLLTPGWRDLIGAPLNQIVATQWATTTRVLLDDLSAVPRDRWMAMRHEAFLAAPQARIIQLCDHFDLAWDRALGDHLPIARHTVSPPHPDKWRSREAEISAVWPIVETQNQRALELFA